MKYLNIIISTMAVAFCSILLHSCGDLDVNEIKGSTDAPKEILDITVENVSGASIIRYKLPDDINLKYVKAEILENGIKRDFNASYYTDSLYIDGFENEGDYEISVYSISTGEIRSNPIKVKISPKTPPYKLIGKTIEAHDTWGGVRMTSKNLTKADLSITLLKKTNSTWIEVGKQYTKSEKIEFIVRGQESEETEYGIFVQDKWSHSSDTIFKTLTPWYEIQLPKNKYKHYHLPTDTDEMAVWSGSKTSVQSLWSGKTDASACFHTKNTDILPQWFTLDLGDEYLISRILMHARTDANKTRYDYVFSMGMPSEVEIWGSKNPAADGSWESWTLLDEVKVTRADGTLVSREAVPINDADKQLIKDGSEFLMPDGTESIRYIRFKTLATYGRIGSVMIGQMAFYGAPANSKRK